MPAAAVIPGPIVYIEFVAVKKFVVGSGRPSGRRLSLLRLAGYFEETRVLKTGGRLYKSA